MPKINQKAILKQLSKDIAGIKAILSIPKEEPKMIHKLEKITKTLWDGEIYYCSCGYNTGRKSALQEHIWWANGKRT